MQADFFPCLLSKASRLYLSSSETGSQFAFGQSFRNPCFTAQAHLKSWHCSTPLDSIISLCCSHANMLETETDQIVQPRLWPLFGLHFSRIGLRSASSGNGKTPLYLITNPVQVGPLVHLGYSLICSHPHFFILSQWDQGEVAEKADGGLQHR